MVSVVVEKHNAAVFNLTRYPLADTIWRGIVFPVKRVNIRYKSNILIRDCEFCANML